MFVPFVGIRGRASTDIGNHVAPVVFKTQQIGRRQRSLQGSGFGQCNRPVVYGTAHAVRNAVKVNTRRQIVCDRILYGGKPVLWFYQMVVRITSSGNFHFQHSVFRLVAFQVLRHDFGNCKRGHMDVVGKAGHATVAVGRQHQIRIERYGLELQVATRSLQCLYYRAIAQIHGVLGIHQGIFHNHDRILSVGAAYEFGICEDRHGGNCKRNRRLRSTQYVAGLVIHIFIYICDTIRVVA